MRSFDALHNSSLAFALIPSAFYLFIYLFIYLFSYFCFILSPVLSFLPPFHYFPIPVFAFHYHFADGLQSDVTPHSPGRPMP
jgi:hypothetical protein